MRYLCRLLKMPRLSKNIVLVCLSLVMASCTFNTVLKRGTHKEKYELAQKLYNKGDYGRSMILLEELIGVVDEDVDPEAVYFRYAFTHFNMGDFTLAGYHFDNFARNYFRSEKAEEASYMSARCEYQKSLAYYLDPTLTYRAIDRIQLFIDKNPQSQFVPECNKLIDELRSKLHTKAYEAAMLYFKMGSYKSAIVAFENAIIDYPGIPQKEEIQYRIVLTHFLYAENSILSSQKERYEKTIKLASDFLKDNPAGPYTKDVENLKEKSQKVLDGLDKKLEEAKEKLENTEE
jgi:outer membrane protein assembly factor BamD